MTTATTANTRHEISLWRDGFAELVAGKPFHVRLDDGYHPDDILVVREYDQATKTLTGAVAMFRITWVTRSDDHDGMLSAILPEGTVILGLAPANVMVVEGGKVSMIVNGRRPEARPQTAPLPDQAVPPPAAEPPQRPQAVARAAAAPSLAEFARAEARRLQSLAKEHCFDPRELADALHRELARAPTLPGPLLRHRPTVASAPPPS